MAALVGLLNNSTTRKEGHSLCLFEPSPGQCTFRDYPNSVTLIEDLVNLFESERSCANEPYDLSQLFDWIDEFTSMKVFIFDASIAQYREYSKDKLKILITEKVSEQMEK